MVEKDDTSTSPSKKKMRNRTVGDVPPLIMSSSSSSSSNTAGGAVKIKTFLHHQWIQAFVLLLLWSACFRNPFFFDSTRYAIDLSSSSQLINTWKGTRRHHPFSDTNCTTTTNDINNINNNNTDLTRLTTCQIKYMTWKAEQIWLRNEGYLWLQHSRKAAGTTLCMTIRQNQFGLIRAGEQNNIGNHQNRKKKKNRHQQSQQQVVLPRQTCQIKDICIDCNYKTKYESFYKKHKLSHYFRSAMQHHKQNFIELEGSGIPEDILVENEVSLPRTWYDYVFISSIRHPIDRIVSSLYNDPKQCGNKRSKRSKKSCINTIIQNKDLLLEKCSNSIYYCYSNYYTRMFSGHDTEFYDQTEETNSDDAQSSSLDIAKLNFYRFSCIILVEYWDETITCLQEKLGLHLLTSQHYNVKGQISVGREQQSKQSQYSQFITPVISSLKGGEGKNDGGGHGATNHLHLLSNSSRQILEDMNQIDLEFYEWAKQEILNGVW